MDKATKIVLQLQQTKCEREKNKLFIQLRKEMLGISRKLRAMFNWRDLLLIDYNQVFDMALFVNVKRYKGDRGSFKNYCFTDLKMAIIDEMNRARSLLKIPTRTARKIYVIKEDDWSNLEEVKDKYKLSDYEFENIKDRPFEFHRDIKLDRHDIDEDEYAIHRDTDTEAEGIED